MQKAKYRNRKEGMETGRTEEERSTAGTADRGKREEGKGKCGRLSSQNRKRRWKTGKPKGRTEALEKPLRGKARKKGTEETEG